MKSKFNIKVTVPSGKTLRIDELLNGQYLTISKFCQNNDGEGFMEYMKSILPLADLNILDKLYLLISFYAMFIDPNLTIRTAEGAEISISVNTILNNIEEAAILARKNVDIDGWVYVLELPHDPTGDLYACITKICVGSIEVVDDIQEVVEQLPITSFSKLSKAIVEFVLPLQTVPLLKANESFNIPEMNLNVISNDYFTFIYSLFKTNLEHIVESIFVFAQKFSSIDYFEMSVLDTRVMLTFLNRQIKEQNDALKSQQK